MPYVYIMASAGGVLYTGVTADIDRRPAEHQAGRGSDFTSKYKCHKLVYVERHHDMLAAIVREKQLKGWKRGKKAALINSINPGWLDLTQRY